MSRATVGYHACSPGWAFHREQPEGDPEEDSETKFSFARIRPQQRLQCHPHNAHLSDRGNRVHRIGCARSVTAWRAYRSCSRAGSRKSRTSEAARCACDRRRPGNARNATLRRRKDATALFMRRSSPSNADPMWIDRRSTRYWARRSGIQPKARLSASSTRLAYGCSGIQRALLARMHLCGRHRSLRGCPSMNSSSLTRGVDGCFARLSCGPASSTEARAASSQIC